MVGVEISDVKHVPDGPLYLGTSYAGKWNLKRGILPKKNSFVLLCGDFESAEGIAATMGRGHFVIKVDAVRMACDGHEFQEAKDGFIASSAISPKYMSRITS